MVFENELPKIDSITAAFMKKIVHYSLIGMQTQTVIDEEFLDLLGKMKTFIEKREEKCKLDEAQKKREMYALAIRKSLATTFQRDTLQITGHRLNQPVLNIVHSNTGLDVGFKDESFGTSAKVLSESWVSSMLREHLKYAGNRTVGKINEPIVSLAIEDSDRSSSGDEVNRADTPRDSEPNLTSVEIASFIDTENEPIENQNYSVAEYEQSDHENPQFSDDLLVEYSEVNDQHSEYVVNTIESYEYFEELVLAVLENLTRSTISVSSDVLFDVLVMARNADRLYFGRIMKLIVEKAIDKLENNALYACLCSELSKRAASGTANGGLRENELKSELMRVSNEMLWGMEIWPQVLGDPEQEELASRARVRMIRTCMFIGELFMQNRFKMVKIVLRMFNTFMRSRDAHSLECVCVLLTIIGERLDKIHLGARFSREQMYVRLQHLGAVGMKQNTLPRRTIQMIDTLIRTRNNQWSRQTAISTTH